VATTVILPNVIPDAPVATVQMRAWDSLGGTITDWSQVLADPTIPRGLSPTFNLTNIGGLNPPPSLIGLQSFNLFIATNQGATLDSPKLAASGGFEFVVNDQLGAVYRIEYSSGLGSGWNNLTTVTNLYGKLPFTDPGATSAGLKLYRAVRLQ